MTPSLRHSIPLALLILSAFTPLCVSAAAPAKPNVVYIMADDVGWGDLSVHGGGVPTPESFTVVPRAAFGVSTEKSRMPSIFSAPCRSSRATTA